LRRWVEAVAEQDVEATGVRIENSLEQPQRRGALILMWAKQFEVEQEAETGANQLKDCGTVVVLRPRLAFDRDLARLTIRAAALVTAVDLVSIDRREAMTAQRQ